MIILGIGSNLHSSFGNKFDNINLSISLLKKNNIEILKKSSFYETPSYPDLKKPKFINVIILIETDLPPVDLMSVLIFIEEKLERKRDKKNDPRTCDIDIIDYNGQVEKFNYKSINVILPHEKVTNRNFVLFPLQEIIPEWKHPKTKETVEVLINKLSSTDKNSILKVVKS